METSLHRTLKLHYAESEDATEVRHGAFRIDAVHSGELIEIQFASLSSIRNKLATLLETDKVRIVKPIVARRRIIRQKTADGPIISRRLSPKRGQTLDLFEELVYLTQIFPHPNLTIDVPLVSVEEWRLPPVQRKSRRGRFRPKHSVKDVVLEEILSSRSFRTRADLKRLAEVNKLPQPFDTGQLAKHLDRRRDVAQRIAYVLRNIGAVEEAGKRGNARTYRSRATRTSKRAA